jgi:thiamine-phosphate pyrophosphorylase
MPQPILAVLTDRTLLSPNWTLAQAIAPAITGGANLVILRESDLPDKPRLDVARFVRDGIRGRVPYLISGSPEFAALTEADGVLLESDSAEHARNVLGARAIVGSILTSSEALEEDVDFALAVLDWSDPKRAIGIVEKLSQRTSLVAGLDPPLESVAPCMAAGAAGIAVCEAAMSAYNRTQAVAAYREALDSDIRHSRERGNPERSR